MGIRITITAYKFNSLLKKSLGIVVIVLLIGTVTYTNFHNAIREIRFTPNAVLGYAACNTTELHTKLASFTEDHPCNFSGSLPAANGLTVVTFVNTGWINLTKNWIYSAEHNGLKGSLFLISLEPGVCKHFPAIPCFHKVTTEIPSSSFAEPTYQKFMIERTRLTLQLLSCPIQTILLADADTVFLQGSLEIIKQEMGEMDIILQRDSTGIQIIDNIMSHIFDYICAGFVYMKVKNSTRLLYQGVLNYQLHHYWNDQAGLNVCIRHHTINIQWKLFSNKFSTGKEFFQFKSTPSNAVVIHANFMKGTTDKMGAMISRGIWYYDEVVPHLCMEFWPKACLVKQPYPWCSDFKRECRTKYHVDL